VPDDAESSSHAPLEGAPVTAMVNLAAAGTLTICSVCAIGSVAAPSWYPNVIAIGVVLMTVVVCADRLEIRAKLNVNRSAVLRLMAIV